MKWARPQSPKEPKPYGGTSSVLPPNNELRKKFIETIDVKSIEALHKKGFREWLICNKKKDWDIISKFSADDRFSYEAFIGGFLAYFELHVSNSKKKENRTVYFDWGKLNPPIPLTIYLKPVNTPYYDSNGKLIAGNKPAKPLSWQAAPSGALRSPLAPPPAPGQTDPPVPPVPPPPPPRFSDQL